MSRGVVCFGTNISTLPELLPHNCLFTKKDDRRLAELLQEAYDNPEKMKAWAWENYNHAKDYDFEVLRKRRNEFLRAFRDYVEQQRR